jgi:hypothetical protein
MTRGRWLAVLVALLLVACASAPGLLRRRAGDLIESRTGCGVVVDGVGYDGTVVLQGVRLECSAGLIRLNRVSVSLDGSLNPARVQIDGGMARLSGLPHLPQPSTSGAGSEPRPEGLRVEVTELAVELVDGEGQELVSAVLAVELDSEEVRLAARELTTATALSPVVRSGVVRVIVERPARRVREVVAEDSAITVHDGPSLEQALRRWRTTSPAQGSTEDDAEVEAPSWMRLAEGGSLRVVRGSVLDEQGTALGAVDADLTRGLGSMFHSRGRGQPRGSGELSWDVELDPGAGTLEGPIILRDVPLSALVPFLPPLPLHEASRTLVSSELRVRTEEGESLAAEGRLSVTNLALDSPRLASVPIRNVSFEVEGAGRWRRAEHLVELERGTIRLGAAHATAAGRILLDGDRFAVELRAALPSTPCSDAVQAIPADLLQELRQLRLDGRLSANVVAHIDSERLEDTVLNFSIDDRCRFVNVPVMADVVRFRTAFRHEVLEPDGTMFEMETGPGTDAWTPLLDISPFLLHAVLAHEDASFFSHAGFAPWAIRDALVRNLRERRYVLGASTLTMQLVKNVFLRREKTLARKVQEVLLTWWVETALTKAQILELYLNVIEYGPSVYGIRNAAAHYFARLPSELSAAESAYLAMVLPNPPRFHEHFESGQVPMSFRRRTAGFIELLARRGRIDAAAAAQGREEIASFAFSRDGARVGPETLLGSSAQLPIEGFSGFPSTPWPGDEGAADPGDLSTEANESEDAAGGWEDWP